MPTPPPLLAPRSIAANVRALARLSLPMVAAQLGTMMLGVVDMLFVGRLGTQALAAVALGNVWVHGTLFVMLGLVMGADPLISQAHGARDREGAALAFQRGIVLALLLSVPLCALWATTAPLLRWAGQDAALAHEAQRFVYAQMPTAVTFLIFNVNRQYLIARGIGAPTVWVVIGANGVNAFLNWVLVFGHLGVPALGVAGAGLATGISRAALAATLWAVTFGFGLQRDAWVPWSRRAFDVRAIGRVVALGLPISLHFGLEGWAFQIATLMAGRLGANDLSAHTIVLNLASLSFMVPLGISMGASARVGNLVGAGDLAGARRNALCALALGAGVMLLSASAFLIFRRELPRLYGADTVVAALAASILPIAAAFQLFDGTQVVGSGVLRGLGRTRPAAVLNFVGYYVLALPLAWWLMFGRTGAGGARGGAGIVGLWWGLALGLAVVAAGISAWIARPATFLGVERARG